MPTPFRLPKPEEDTSTYLDWWFCSNACLTAAIEDETPAHYRAKATERDDPDVKTFLRKYGHEETSETLRADYWALVAQWKKRKVEEVVDARRRLSYRIGREDFAAEQKELDKRIEDSVERGRKLQEKSQREMEEFRAEMRRAQAVRDFQAQQFDELCKPKQIPERALFEHTHILGPSGSGKTSLLLFTIIRHYINKLNPAFVVIDPKGTDLVEPLARVKSFRDRIVLIDPLDKPALNLFVSTSNPAEIISSFAYIFSTSNQKLTGQQEACFSFCVRLIFGLPGATLFTLLDLLDDDAKNRDPRFVAAVANLNPNNPADAIARRFFERDFYSSTFSTTREQIKTRVYAIARDEYLGAMFNAPERKLDLAQCIRDRKLVLVNTRLDELKGNHQTLGRYIISLFIDAIMGRAHIPEDQWHPTFLVIDEFQEFADSAKTPHMLRLMRRYNAGAVLAHHNMFNDVFDDAIRSAISTNTGIKFASKPAGMDINYMARDMQCETEFLTKTAVKSETHARFACTFTGLDHPFIAEVPFGCINQLTKLTTEEYRALRAQNKAALTQAPNRTDPPVRQTDQPAAAPEQPPPRASRPSADDPEAGSTW